MKSNTILLIGGSNIDYIANSVNKLVRHDSNIGKLAISFGGVMRNVVENLQLLGNHCVFLTAIGEDSLGKDLRKYMEEIGTKIYSPVTDMPTSSYLAINDFNHDMDVAINDMRIIEKLNDEFLKENEKMINDHEYIVLDSNLSVNCLDYLFTHFPKKKFIVEGISVAKVVKFKNFLNKIFMMKCNIYEAKALLGQDFDVKTLALGLMAKGCYSCVISQGKEPVCFGEKGNVGFVEIDHIVEIAKGNTTGCGDALFAGIIDQYLQGKSLRESIKFGNKLSQLTIESDKAVNQDIRKYFYEH